MNSQGQQVILAVEDSETDMYLLQRVLDTGAQRIIRARDGEQAIELLRELAERGRESLPDLIVIDLNLPRIDGYEMLAHLGGQNAFCAIPVVVVTSSQSETDRKKALAAGADAYFVKPMDIAAYGRLPNVIDDARRVRSQRLKRPPHG